jgi:ankyrin repeat protein
MFSSAPATGFTAFLFAVRGGSLDAVKALLDAGVNVNDTLSDGSSALVVATANAHWELASLLLDRGADPNLAAAGWTALHQAVRIRRPNIGFGTPGPIPTGTVDSIDVIKKMIARGANLNARMSRNGMKDGQRNRLNRLGATPFLLAAKNTDVDVMRLLIAAGADAKTPTADGTTPLMVAAGVAIWNPGEDGGSLAGQEAEVLEAVKICVEHGNDVNLANDLGETALHGAAFRGVNEVVQYLADRGAKLDARDSRGWTPLAIANGLTYTDFFKQQVHTAKLLRELMAARGLPTDGHAVDPKVCLDCLQTRADQQREVLERDRRMQAEWTARERASQQP